MNEQDDVFIVGYNITKHEAYFACRDKVVLRAAQGIYFRAGKSADELFHTYGLRIVNYSFTNVALTHSTAWYKQPVDGRIFVGGEYPYKKIIAAYAGDFRIVQSMVHADFADQRMYERITLEDPFGSFEMFCSSPEMILIQLMDATKQNVEKHLPDREVEKIMDLLRTKYGSKSAILMALEEIAIAADKQNEFDRLLKMFFLQKRRN